MFKTILFDTISHTTKIVDDDFDEVFKNSEATSDLTKMLVNVYEKHNLNVALNLALFINSLLELKDQIDSELYFDHIKKDYSQYYDDIMKYLVLL